MSIAAIIVNYHTSIYIPDLIKDLSGIGEVDQVFVVDNSGEVELLRLKSGLSQDRACVVELIKPGKNIGFGAGVNLASARASSEYLLVINPDVRLFPGCLEHLLAAARKYGSLLTGPRFFWDDEKRYRLPPSQGASSWFDYAGEAAGHSRLDLEHFSFYWQMRHERFWSSTTPFAEIFLSGACMLIQRQWILDNNSIVFDKSFFLYFEDNDISLRAYFDGVPPLCVPGAEALHYYDQSPAPEESKGELMAGSHARFSGKYYGNLKFLLNTTDYYLPDICEVGPITSPFSINIDMFQPTGSLYFEIGVNPFFVPFAQTEWIKNRVGDDVKNFALDESIWNRMAKGIYYGRIRDSLRGVLKIWRWEKV